MIPLAAVAAPTAQFNFKVVSYDQNEKQNNQTRNNKYDYSNAPTTNASGPQMGGFQDQEQDRNIDMNELHELLGN